MTSSFEILARVDEILPRIEARNDEADEDGQIQGETVQELIDAEILSTLAPKVYGGLELDLHTFSQIVQRVSAVSPSAGWVCSFLIGASWRLLIFPREGQEEIFGGRNYVLGAGAAAPIFDVKKVDGGFLLSGRTAWNSGSSAAHWFQMNGLVKVDDGPPTLMMFAMPREDVTILDNWHILGMKGTASCDLVVENVFVPERRSAPFTGALSGNSEGHRLHNNSMYHIPFVPFAMCEVVPVIVGTHRGASSALLDRTRERMGTLSGVKAIDKVPAQIRMAQGIARSDMAEQMLTAMIGRITSNVSDSTEPINRAEIKLQAAMISDFCLNSVNEMARSVGGDAFRNEAAFQRYFRDINTVSRHAFLDPDTAGESVGKMTLGLPVSDPMI